MASSDAPRARQPAAERGPAGQATTEVQAIGPVVRLLCQVRLAVLALGLVTAVAGTGLTPGALLVVVLALPLSFAPSPVRERQVESLTRSGLVLALDLAVTAALVAVMPDYQPMVMYAAATVALHGITVGLLLSAVTAAPVALALITTVSGREASPPAAVLVVTPLALAAMAWAGTRLGDRLRAQARLAGELRQAQAGQAATLERVRIARDLHDTVAGDLAGILLLTSALNRRLRTAEVDPEVRRLANELEAACGAAHASTRAVLGGLRRAGEAPQTLLEDVCRQWSQRVGVVVDAVVDPGLSTLSSAATDDLRSILLEALENVHRHAGATRVTVRAQHAADGVRLSVADDGRGLVVTDPADVGLLAPRDGAGHWGLVGMQERARLHGGDVAVTGAPGRGTTVTVRFEREEVVVP